MSIRNMVVQMREQFKKTKALSKENKENTVQVFKTPDFLNKQYHIRMVTEKGLFILKDYACTILYKIVQDSGYNADTEIQFFEILRSYDFEYRFFYYGIQDLYLELLIKPENQNKSIDMEMIEQLEQDMFLKLSECGITLRAMWLDDRLRLIHKRIYQYDEAADKNVMNYIKNVKAWKEDMTLKSYISDENTLQIGDYRIQMAFVRKFPQTSIKEYVQHLLLRQDIECVMIQYCPIKDEALKSFFQNNYMGCDNELRKLQTKNPVLYKILSGNTLSDTRTYCFMGISILYVQNDSMETISNKESDYGVKISDYQTNPFRTFVDFLPLGEWNYNQCRLFLNEDIKNTIPIVNSSLTIQEEYSESDSNEFFM